MADDKKPIVNSGHYQFLGTDKIDDGEKYQNNEYLEYRKKWKENPANKIVGEFPIHLDIETTNNCNLRCTMCGRNQMKERLGYMDQDLFKKIIDEGAKYKLASIKLNYRGEPLLHPKVVEMVRYAKEKGVLEVQFNTNGFLLDGKTAENLIDAGLDRIIFSFDAARKETYNKIRRGSDYDKVMANIKKLVEIRNKKGLKKPLVRVQMVKMQENKDEIEDFIKMWQKIANRLAVSTHRDPLGAQKKVEHFACPQIWQRLMVCWDGEVRMCCGDWYGEYVLGNVKNETLCDIWLSEKLQAARKIHEEGKFDAISVCAKCEVNSPRIDIELEKLLEKYNK